MLKAAENQKLYYENYELKCKYIELDDKNNELKKEIERLNGMLTPELQDINVATAELEKVKSALQIEKNNYIKCVNDLQKLTAEIEQKQSEILQLDDAILFQSFGLYEPKFDFCNSDEYKKALIRIREKQQKLIKDDCAVTGSTSWSVNGDDKAGTKMVNDMKKLLLRTFNGECDELVSKVKYNNYEAYVKKIETSCNAISRLGKIMSLAITNAYKDLKIEELTLAFEYAQKKNAEKEEQKALKAQMREEAKLQKEIEEKRKKLEKEQTHYINALERLEVQLSADPENQDLLQKKQELEAKADEIDKSIKDVDYREANKRAGYVYVISNIGAFGKDIYKIGMTRRLDPMERVDELGDASVPFNFDVHAMIFTKDAPALETSLHKAFEDKKVNMVNQRREFFNVTLDEIKAVVKANYDKTVEFIDIPDAEQYRVSLKMKQQA